MTDALHSGPKTNTLAILSLVFSIGSFLVTWFVPLVASIAGVVCGHIARGQIKRSGGSETGEGLALAGLIIGYIGIAMGLATMLFLSAVLAALTALLFAA
jgi:uncharacterized protein YqgC (DUF456 family)